MRQYCTNYYLVETPEQLQALWEMQPDGNHSMWMLARVWRAENVRREHSGKTYNYPVTRVRVAFDTRLRRCVVYREGVRSRLEEIGQMDYNKTLRHCRGSGLKLLESEVAS